jgi:hypothetical protein
MKLLTKQSHPSLKIDISYTRQKQVPRRKNPTDKPYTSKPMQNLPDQALLTCMCRITINSRTP